jgi:glucose-1-phosphate thymidylyltransferase
MYLSENVLKVEIMDGSSHWFDTGTHDALLEASNFVKALQSRLGKIIASPDEISFNLGLIDKNQISKNALKYQGSSYGDYLRELAEK